MGRTWNELNWLTQDRSKWKKFACVYVSLGKKDTHVRADPQILKCNDDYYFQRSQRHSESGYKESPISLVFSNQIKKLENILCHVCDLSARAYHTL